MKARFSVPAAPSMGHPIPEPLPPLLSPTAGAPVIAPAVVWNAASYEL
eukprot:CAMPEP_0119034642 /NCGR_PEP_ID=MMETSP1177-20130426/1645_1 /TAXON_ID=2985 /ORGANISM="Ochromonas sp, Strain CCMP1899" /LENGTH=47 /DNA_ID= /DNA_START= /DNA_END= /DNA_ORIENTATION=